MVRDMTNESISEDQKSVQTPLPDYPTKEEIDEFFIGDTFAYKQADCRIVEAWKGHGVAEMTLNPSKHFNAQNRVMGGAVFTLADYAFAGASMCGQLSSVTLSCNVEFMKATKGKKLIATCDVEQSGRRVGFYSTTVVDDLGVVIARLNMICYHPNPLPTPSDIKS